MRPYTHTRHASAFTMIEIAIAVAVIAFALVAVLRSMPLGLEVQRDNREETVVNQDGPFILEAIRGGDRVTDELAPFVDRITVNGVPQDITTGSNIVRALSSVDTTNVMWLRCISGAAAEKSPNLKDFSMRYQVVSQVRRVSGLDSLDASPYRDPLGKNLYEIRLVFYWPLTPAGTLAEYPRRQVFRTLVSGQVDDGFLDTGGFRK